MSEATNVPGVNDEMINSGEYHAPQRDLHNFHSHSTGKPVGEGTVTPDAGDAPDDIQARRSSFVNKGKPIFGFLYSVSRTAFGEFWPLYLGPNTIGRVDSDIILEEGTVSEHHAVITIHQDEETHEVFASLADKESTHGVRLNGRNIRFDRVECKNMDIVKIGKNYELLFILVDTGTLNLKPCESFIPVQKKSVRQVDRRIVSGTNSRLSNPSSSERTVSADPTENTMGGGTRTR